MYHRHKTSDGQELILAVRLLGPYSSSSSPIQSTTKWFRDTKDKCEKEVITKLRQEQEERQKALLSGKPYKPLHDAAKMSKKEMKQRMKTHLKFRWLLDYHGDLTARTVTGTYRGQNAVGCVVLNITTNVLTDNVAVLKLLLEEGCSPNIRDRNHTNRPVFESLLSVWGNGLVTGAVVTNRLQLTNLLIEHGVSLTKIFSYQNYGVKRSPLQLVAEKGLTTVLPALLEARGGEMLLWQQDTSGNTPLHIALTAKKKDFAMNLWEASSIVTSNDSRSKNKQEIDPRVFFIRNSKNESIIDLAIKICVTGSRYHRELFQFINTYAEKKRSELWKLIEEEEIGKAMSDGDASPANVKKVVFPRIDARMKQIEADINLHIIERSRNGERNPTLDSICNYLRMKAMERNNKKLGKSSQQHQQQSSKKSIANNNNNDDDDDHTSTTIQISSEEIEAERLQEKILALSVVACRGHAGVGVYRKRRLTWTRFFTEPRNVAPLSISFGLWIAYIVLRNHLSRRNLLPLSLIGGSGEGVAASAFGILGSLISKLFS